MKWTRETYDGPGFSKYTSDCGEYEIVKLYENLPNGDAFQLNVRGYFKGTGTLSSLKTAARWDKRHN